MRVFLLCALRKICNCACAVRSLWSGHSKPGRKFEIKKIVLQIYSRLQIIRGFSLNNYDSGPTILTLAGASQMKRKGNLFRSSLQNTQLMYFCFDFAHSILNRQYNISFHLLAFRKNLQIKYINQID